MHQSLFSRRLKEWKKVELLLPPPRRQCRSLRAALQLLLLFYTDDEYSAVKLYSTATQDFCAAVEWLNYRPDLHSKHNGVNNILKSQLNLCMHTLFLGLSINPIVNTFDIFLNKHILSKSAYKPAIVSEVKAKLLMKSQICSKI